MAQIGTIFSIVAGIGFMLIGMSALAQPAVLSHLYGLYAHERNGRGFVRACGARDVAFGTLLLVFARTSPAALFVTLMAGGLLAAADFLIVWSTNRRFEAPFLVPHLFGMLVLFGLATIVGIANLSR